MPILNRRVFSSIGIISALLFCKGHAFIQTPWLYSPYQLVSTASYKFQYFSTVDDGFNPVHYDSVNNFVYLELLGTLSPTWDAQIALDLDATRRVPFGVLDVAAQYRQTLWNEFLGDMLSCDVYGMVRYVPHDRLEDVATPFHAAWNIEVGTSAGREFSQLYHWNWRTYALFAIGMANRGYPWIRADYHVEGKFLEQDALSFHAEGYFGTGNQTFINVSDFNGYASVRHRSIDLGLQFTHYFVAWGHFDIRYMIRVYAKSYPAGMSSVQFRYRLPFSF